MRPGRIRDRRSFAELARSGRRVRRGALTLVLLPDPEPSGECRVAYAIARTVGPAVTRNLVRRRLRELVRARASALPPGALLIRVAPAAAAQSFRELGRSLDEALAALAGLAAASPAAPASPPRAGASS